MPKVFLGLAIGLMLSALNQTLVATALPTIVGELGGLDQLPWVVTAYLLTSTIVIPLVGRLSDRFGHGAMFRASIIVFMAGSLIAAVSTSMVVLVIARGVQGLGGGGLITLAMIIVAELVPISERGRYQGYIAAIFGVASVTGPLLGGLFVDQLSWRWAFFVNVALSAVALVMTRQHLPMGRRTTSTVPADGIGAVLLVVTLSSMMLLTMWAGRTAAWTSPLIVALVLGTVAGLVLFVLQERRAPAALLPLELFANPTVALMAIISFAHGVAMFGVIVYAPSFVQVGVGTDATTSGLAVMPLMGGLVVASMLGGRRLSSTGRYKPLAVAGSLVTAIGLTALSTLDRHVALWLVAAIMGVIGFGLGLVGPVAIVAVQSEVPGDQLGVATSSNQFVRKIGGMLGVAVFGGVFTAAVASRVSSAGLGVDGASGVLDTPAAIERLDATTQSVVRNAIADGSGLVFRLTTVVAVLGVIVALRLRDGHLDDAPRRPDGALVDSA